MIQIKICDEHNDVIREMSFESNEDAEILIENLKIYYGIDLKCLNNKFPLDK